MRADHHRRARLYGIDDLGSVHLMKVYNARGARQDVAEPRLKRGLGLTEIGALVDGHTVYALARFIPRNEHVHFVTIASEHRRARLDVRPDSTVSRPARCD